MAISNTAGSPSCAAAVTRRVCDEADRRYSCSHSLDCSSSWACERRTSTEPTKVHGAGAAPTLTTFLAILSSPFPSSPNISMRGNCRYWRSHCVGRSAHTELDRRRGKWLKRSGEEWVAGRRWNCRLGRRARVSVKAQHSPTSAEAMDPSQHCDADCSVASAWVNTRVEMNGLVSHKQLRQSTTWYTWRGQIPYTSLPDRFTSPAVSPASKHHRVVAHMELPL